MSGAASAAESLGTRVRGYRYWARLELGAGQFDLLGSNVYMKVAAKLLSALFSTRRRRNDIREAENTATF